MEEVGQRHSGEGGEDFRAVQGIVNALGAPPLDRDCRAEKKVRTDWPAQGCGPRGSVGSCYTDPAVYMPPGHKSGVRAPSLQCALGNGLPPSHLLITQQPFPLSTTPLGHVLHIGPQE